MTIAESATPKKATAGDVLDTLERSYSPKKDWPSGLFMREVGAPDGKRRADALWLPAAVSGAVGTGIIGHEVKVSRADVVVELSDPSKAWSWQRYCTQWWLVIPDAKLIDGLELPVSWGVKVAPTRVNGRTFTVLRDAPILEPEDLCPALARISTKLAFERVKKDAAVAKAERMQAYAEGRLERAEQDAARQGQATLNPLTPFIEAVDAEITRLREQNPSRNPLWSIRHIDASDVAQALLDLHQTRALTTDISHVANGKLRQLELLLGDLRDSAVLRDASRVLGELSEKESRAA
ncbi:hypothetical protein V6N00_12530 [Tersicoccus sp. MR15.9]|uniref:hypothetical protein n=1 Tax=Tersicoccus mangrovi TaxID=3121635 RepID=UPI002FE579DF